MSSEPAPEPLPPGPYRVEWPAEQGGLFKVWGRQGTPSDFADGWAIPLVAAGTQPVMEWLADHLNALATPSSVTADLRAIEAALRAFWLDDRGKFGKHACAVRDESVEAAVERLASVSSVTPDLRAVIEAAFDKIESACPVCGGDRWTFEADPSDESSQTPMQVQCWDVEHVVVAEQRSLLAASVTRHLGEQVLP